MTGAACGFDAMGNYYIPIIPAPRWQDVVDVLIVAYVIYRVALLIRGTRTMQMVAGMVIVGVAFVASQVMGLFTLNWLLNNFLGSFFVILVVLFQADIRRALTRVGARPFFGPRPTAASTADELTTAAAWLSARKIGALIVIEQNDGLAELVESGRIIDARVSPELIETIFMPGSPLHDGALIIKGGQALAASCLLPLSTNPGVSLALGTRHRAALGLTEDSDAVVLVVSEEDGTISLSRDGSLRRGLEPAMVLEELKKLPV
jgi:diadenylate cyclase